MNDFGHTPVLLEEAINALSVKKDKWYVDGTIGGGGHADYILRLKGKVLGIDQDPDSIEFLQKKYEGNKNVLLVQSNFSDIKKITQKHNVRPSGILFDLGLSSYQIEKSQRGFSFSKDEVLDMRMGKVGVSAYEIINKASKEELYEIFNKLGEEHFALPISDAIISARRIKPIKTSLELAKIIENAVGHRGKLHPATRVFQALRMTVNMELTNLKKGINEGFDILAKEGYFAIISFHSLEDRVVKLAFQDFVSKGAAQAITKKPIVASVAQVQKNKRARSAKLRAIKKLN